MRGGAGGSGTGLGGVWYQALLPLWLSVWVARGTGPGGSGNVGSEEKGAEDNPPPCSRSDPEAHAGIAGRDGPAAGVG